MPTTNTRQKRSRPLNHVIVAAAMGSVAVGTISWTSIELAIEEPLNREHLYLCAIPAVVTGLVIVVVLSFLLNRFVVEPIQEISPHLCRIGSGRLEPIELDTGVKEIQAMVDSVNLLVRRLRAPSGDASFTRVQERLQTLRRELRSMADAGGAESELFLKIAKEMRVLEADVLAISNRAPTT